MNKRNAKNKQTKKKKSLELPYIERDVAIRKKRGWSREPIGHGGCFDR